jgi:hypothetical protein
MFTILTVLVCTLQSIFPCLLESGLLAIQDDLVLTSIEPGTVEAFGPFTLILKGEGFSEDTVVMIQTSRGDKYLKYKPVFISSEELQLNMRSGFGLNPRQRKMYVSNSFGSSNTATMQIVPKGSLQEEEQEPELQNGQPAIGEIGIKPVISELQPASILVGQPFELLIIGENFQEDATALVEANVNAGTARNPEYQLREFEVEYLADTMLLLKFDRGFAPKPENRQILIENPDGGRSAPLSLAVITNVEQKDE